MGAATISVKVSELTAQSATKLAAMIRAREVSPVEVMEAHLRRIEALNPRLNAIVTLAPDAMERARAAEAALMRDEVAGPLHGLPVTVKDTIDTAGLPTTCGAVGRAGHLPSKDAGAAARLKAAGAIILGKTNVSEMALSYESDNPLFGRTINPYDEGRTAGGSSGGEAAAISCCLSPAGIGSDLMGSIRVPAHFCGCVGLKPTTGRIPCDGHTPPAEGPLSLGAVIGPLARRIEDLSLLLPVLTTEDVCGAMRGMATEQATLRPSEDAALKLSAMRGRSAAWYDFDGVSAVSAEISGAVRAAVSALADAGLKVREERPPSIERGPELWTKLFGHAARHFLRRAYEGREETAGADAHFLLVAALNEPAMSLDDYILAWNERDRLRFVLLEWMKETPIIVAPVGASAAFEHGARKVLVGEHRMSVFRSFSYSQTFNVYGLPSVSVPAGRTPSGLPVGVQVIGRPFAEEMVLQAASVIEEALGGWAPPVLGQRSETATEALERS